MAKNDKDNANSAVVSKKERIVNVLVFIGWAFGAVIIVFPLIYMVMTSFMTKNQILSGQLSIIPDPWVFGKYSEVMQKANFISGIMNTVKVEIPVLLIGGFTSSLAAIAFAKMRYRGKGALFMRLLATMKIPNADIIIPQKLI